MLNKIIWKSYCIIWLKYTINFKSVLGFNLVNYDDPLFFKFTFTSCIWYSAWDILQNIWKLLRFSTIRMYIIIYHINKNYFIKEVIVHIYNFLMKYSYHIPMSYVGFYWSYFIFVLSCVHEFHKIHTTFSLWSFKIVAYVHSKISVGLVL